MKKFKLAILTVAVLLSVGGALVTRANSDCTFAQQYKSTGTSYVMVNNFGADYYCEDGATTCTYILSGGQFVQCRVGVFVSLKAADQKK